MIIYIFFIILLSEACVAIKTNCIKGKYSPKFYDVDEFSALKLECVLILKRKCRNDKIKTQWFKDNKFLHEEMHRRTRVRSYLRLYPVKSTANYSCRISNKVFNFSLNFLVRTKYSLETKTIWDRVKPGPMDSVGLDTPRYWMPKMTRQHHLYTMYPNTYLQLNCWFYVLGERGFKPKGQDGIQWFHRYARGYPYQYETESGDPVLTSDRAQVITKKVNCRVDSTMPIKLLKIAKCYHSKIVYGSPEDIDTGEYFCFLDSVSKFSFYVDRKFQTTNLLAEPLLTPILLEHADRTNFPEFLFTNSSSVAPGSLFIWRCWSDIKSDLLKIVRSADNQILAMGNGKVSYNRTAVDLADSGQYFCISVRRGNSSMFLSVVGSPVISTPQFSEEQDPPILDVTKHKKIILVAVVGVASAGLILIFCVFLMYATRFNRRPNRIFHIDLSNRRTSNCKKVANPTYLCASGEETSGGDRDWEVARARVIVLHAQLIGKGSFGQVFRGSLAAHDSSSSSEVAVKMASSLLGEEMLREEVKVMQRIGQHPHVIRLLRVCTEPGGPFMAILELAEMGLDAHLRAHNPLFDLDCPRLKENTLIGYCQQIADAMWYLSNIAVIHRDLAVRNVLLCHGDTVKIADFGFSRICRTYHKKFPEMLGPIRHMAPECFSDNRYSTESDVWAFGVTVWEIFELGATPYPELFDNLAVETAVLLGNVNEAPPGASAAMFGLLQRCWQFRAHNRPSFLEIKLFLDSATSNEYLEPF